MARLEAVGRVLWQWKVAAEKRVITTLVVARSANHKLGNIPTTMRQQVTCPRSCPLFNAGCYGENRGQGGRPSPFQLMERSDNPYTLADLRARKWRTVPPAIRFNVVGDFLQSDGTPDLEYIEETNLTATSQPWVAWSYTHAWRDLDPKQFDYVVRASCETPEEVLEARALGWETVLVVAEGSPIIGTKIGDRQVVQCPATNGKAANCENCRLCGRNAAVVAFPVHGAKKKKAAAAVAAKNKEVSE